jgi:hypothetical protein
MMKLRHAARWLTRTHATPALCVACIAASIHHPAGPLRRRTRARVHGRPICERHTRTDTRRLLGRTP